MKKYRFLALLFFAFLLFGIIFFNASKNTYKTYLKSDLQYKEALIKGANNPGYKIEKLSSIVGPYELENFIKKNSDNIEIYTPTQWNIKNGIFRANFHAHTTNSDGKLSVVEYLDLASEYADKIAPKKIYIAITDHNTLNGAKEVIDVLQSNPNKYKNLKIILGMEVYSEMGPRVPLVLKDIIHIHLVALGINPYDEQLNYEFRKISDDKWNYSKRQFEDAIKLMSKKGLIGIAHPARYIRYDNVVHYETYIDYLFLKYRLTAPNNLKFTEGYYQSYDSENPKIIGYVRRHCDLFKIKKIGDIDNHGRSLFEKL